MNSNTFYNPETNQVRSGTYEERSLLQERGFINLGDRKIAEAFTYVSPEERSLLWEAFNQKKTYSFNFSMLNSKLRHKLNRLGLHQLRDRDLERGEALLEKINNKK